MSRLHAFKKHSFIIVLLAYGIVSYYWLTRFPFVHSDESWLSGLTRMFMTTGTFKTTEPFFDLYPRSPHAIKILFHVLQMPFILIFGYSIKAVRVLSLIFGLFTIGVFHRILKGYGFSSFYSASGAFLLGASSQFVYASHMARQEIVVLFFMLFAFERIRSGHITTGILISAAGMWVHPNGVMSAAILFFVLFFTDRRMLPKFIVIHLISAAVLIFSSLALDPGFFSNYLSYGETLGVTASPAGRLKNFGDFYLKLYYRISATYYNSDIRIALTMMVAALPISLLRWNRQASKDCVSAIIAFNITLFAIGRYNPTSILFIFPWIIIGIIDILNGLNPRVRLGKGILLTLLLLTVMSTAYEVWPTYEDNYTAYLNQIRAAIPANEMRLGNLNTEFASEVGTLLDYRNLNYLSENGMTLREYLSTHDVRYVIVTDELDYLARNPKWHILYGDVRPWYNDLMTMLETKGEIISTIRDDVYSIRIVRYIRTPEWHTTIYRLKEGETW